MSYTSLLGRELLKKRKMVLNHIIRKWHGVFFQDFRLKWKTIWSKERFWECLSVCRAWHWAIHIMNTFVSGRDARRLWQPLTWKQGIFFDNIPRKFNQMKRIWMELRIVVLWSLWIERNEKVYDNITWMPDKLTQTIWNGMIDYGWVEWDEVKIKMKSCPTTVVRLRKDFFACRGRNEVFAVTIDNKGLLPASSLNPYDLPSRFTGPGVPKAPHPTGEIGRVDLCSLWLASGLS